MCKRCIHATEAVRETAAAFGNALRLPTWALRALAAVVATVDALLLALAAYLLALHTPT